MSFTPCFRNSPVFPSPPCMLLHGQATSTILWQTLLRRKQPWVTRRWWTSKRVCGRRWIGTRPKNKLLAPSCWLLAQTNPPQKSKADNHEERKEKREKIGRAHV